MKDVMKDIACTLAGSIILKDKDVTQWESQKAYL
jgi:hypothetical protein